MSEIKGYGGVDGISGKYRPLDLDDRFEAALNRRLGDLMRVSDTLCKAVWGSLANVDWTHTSGDRATYSFRAAADLVATIRGNGNYMDWYFTGLDGVVHPIVAEVMATEGWVVSV